MSPEEKIAWCTGFYEGEGSISVSHSGKNYYCVMITISQKYPEPLRKFRDYIGFGKVNGPYKNTGRDTTFYQWYCPLERVKDFKNLLYTHLSSRRQKQIDTVFGIVYYNKKEANGTITSS